MSLFDSFFTSYLGQWVFQSVIHSLITLFVVEQAIGIWDVRSPLGRFRYRVLVLALPVVMYPVFQFLTPERGDFFFRQERALFDGTRWLGLELWHMPAGAIVFFFSLGLTSLVMLFQEALPILKDALRGKSGQYHPAGPDIKAIEEELLRGKGITKPEIYLIEDDHPLIFTSGTKTIVLSDGLTSALGRAELKSALAHEIAHIIRRSNLTTFFIFLLRLMMFYNPVSLLVFRHIVHDDEQVCDDLTVSMTGDPGSLASALKSFYSETSADDLSGVGGLARMREKLESSSHDLRLRERIERLEGLRSPLIGLISKLEDRTALGDNNNGTPLGALEGPSGDFEWPGFIMTSLSVMAACYFAV